MEFIVGQMATCALGHRGRVSTEVDPFWFPLYLLGAIGASNTQEVAAAERGRSFAILGADCSDSPAGQLVGGIVKDS